MVVSGRGLAGVGGGGWNFSGYVAHVFLMLISCDFLGFSLVKSSWEVCCKDFLARKC